MAVGVEWMVAADAVLSVDFVEDFAEESETAIAVVLNRQGHDNLNTCDILVLATFCFGIQ